MRAVNPWNTDEPGEMDKHGKHFKHDLFAVFILAIPFIRVPALMAAQR
jgi:hypothetical protein